MQEEFHYRQSKGELGTRTFRKGQAWGPFKEITFLFKKKPV